MLPLLMLRTNTWLIVIVLRLICGLSSMTRLHCVEAGP
jgi:hypothetical protein